MPKVQVPESACKTVLSACARLPGGWRAVGEQLDVYRITLRSAVQDGQPVTPRICRKIEEGAARLAAESAESAELQVGLSEFARAFFESKSAFIESRLTVDPERREGARLGAAYPRSEAPGHVVRVRPCARKTRWVLDECPACGKRHYVGKLADERTVAHHVVVSCGASLFCIDAWLGRPSCSRAAQGAGVQS